MSRTAATLVGVAAAGFLVWLAAQFDRGTTGGFWAALGVLAGGGAAFGLTQVRGRRGSPRSMLLFAFLPVLVVAGWVLLSAQPHSNWFREHTASYSSDIGVRGIVRDLATYFGLLAFAVGLVLGLTLEPGRRRVEERPAMPTADPAFDDGTASAPTAAELARLENERAEREALAARDAESENETTIR